MSRSKLPRIALTWLFAVIAAVYALAVTAKYGPGLSSDGIHYMTAARSLIERGALSTYTGFPLVSYAPLLSWVYAILTLTGLHVETAARLVNAVSYGAIILIVGRFGMSLPIRQDTVFVLTLLGSLLSVALTGMVTAAMSETLFIALILAVIWNAHCFVKDGTSRHYIWMCVTSAAAALTRYIGITIVFVCLLTMVLCIKSEFLNKFRLSLKYAVTALLPLCLWLVRNFTLTGTFMGHREPSLFTLHEMVFDTLWSWTSWFVPFRFGKSTTLFSLLILAALLTFTVYSLRYRGATNRSKKLLSFMIVAYIVTYSFFLVLSVALIQFEGLSGRMWSPVAIPVILLVILHGIDTPTQKGLLFLFVRLLAVALTASWIAAGGVNAAKISQKGFYHGLGVFGVESWRHSQTCRFLRLAPLAGKVYSNFPEPLYYYSGLVAFQTPHRGPMRVAFETYPCNKEEFIRELREDEALNRDVYIVWFTNPRRSHFMLRLDELKGFLDLSEERRFEDGFIFRVRFKRTAVKA